MISAPDQHAANQRQFRQACRDHVSAKGCARADLERTIRRLAHDLKTSAASPHLTRAAASNPQEQPMAKDDDGPKEYQRPDAAKAFEIYNKQIKPKLAKIDTARGECSQPWQDIKEHANFPRPVMNFLILLENIDDDAKRDHFLLALSDGLKVNKRFLPRDLVTIANGEENQDIVGTEDRDGTDDLATLGEDDEDEQFEMSEEERSRQTQRPSVQQAKAKDDAAQEAAAGTGAAARSAMRKSSKPSEPAGVTAH